MLAHGNCGLAQNFDVNFCARQDLRTSNFMRKHMNRVTLVLILYEDT